MVSQYPHTIAITTNPDPIEDPNTGIFSAVTGGGKTYNLKCRAEMNSAGKKISGGDGDSIVFNFAVYLPRMPYIIPRGSDYILLRGSETYKGKTLGASNDQMSSRIWV